MRMSRPNGISQENRSHPFFIILRKIAENQRFTSERLTKKLITHTGWHIAVCLLFWLINPLAISNILIVGGTGCLQLAYFEWELAMLKKIVKACCYTEVEQMIYSNDYQYQSLSNEQLVNMMNDANRVMGRFDSFEESLRIGDILIYSYSVIIAVFLICLRVL